MCKCFFCVRTHQSAPAPDPHALHAAPIPPHKVAIIGAGIAGASAAHAFLARGANVTVFDTAQVPASGASGNRLALLMPRLDAGDTGPARILLASFLAARALYADMPGTHALTIEQRPRGEEDTARFAKLLADPPLPPDMLSTSPNGALLHHGGLILEPAKLIPALLKGAALKLGSAIKIDLPNRQIDGEDFDAIILANGMGIHRFAETGWLPLAPRLGQVETGIDTTEHTSAIAAGHYALALGTVRLWGATFTKTDQDIPKTSQTARTHNRTVLNTLVPENWVSDKALSSRAGIRATTPDKLPFAGRAPNYEDTLTRFASLKHGVMPALTPPSHTGIWLLGGLGARGFTFAPYLGEHIAALAYNTPLPLGRTEAELITPLRFIFRDLKRDKTKPTPHQEP